MMKLTWGWNGGGDGDRHHALILLTSSIFRIAISTKRLVFLKSFFAQDLKLVFLYNPWKFQVKTKITADRRARVCCPSKGHFSVLLGLTYILISVEYASVFDQLYFEFENVLKASYFSSLSNHLYFQDYCFSSRAPWHGVVSVTSKPQFDPPRSVWFNAKSKTNTHTLLLLHYSNTFNILL